MSALFWRGSVQRWVFLPLALAWTNLPRFATPLIREVLALLLCLFSGTLAIYGYLRWLRNEKAMRLKEDLPYTRGLVTISTILLAVAVVVIGLIFYGG